MIRTYSVTCFVFFIFSSYTVVLSQYSLVQNYIGGFLNTAGGVVHFGVSSNGRIEGVSCTRSEEDAYKLTVDNIVRLFQPKVSPTLYRSVPRKPDA